MATDSLKDAASRQVHTAAVKAPRASSWMASATWGCLTVAGAGAVPLAIVGAWFVVHRMRKKKAPEAAAKSGRPVLSRSLPMAALHGGKTVIERMIAARDVEMNPEVTARSAMEEMRQLLASPLRIDFVELSRVASKFEMSGKEDEAIKMLEDALKKAVDGRRWHNAHELQVLLLEMLIYKGKYDEVVKSQFDEEIKSTDARVPLFQAIANSMLGHKENAQQCYGKFQGIRECFYTPDTFNKHSKFYNVVNDFDEFQKFVEYLKGEIEKARS